MNFALQAPRAPSVDQLNRRLIGAVLVSLLLHALVLSLRFGVPGLGLGLASGGAPINIRIAKMSADPAPPVPPLAPTPVADAPVPAATTPPVSGMGLVDPRPAPVPLAPAPAAPPLRRERPRQARRISSPVPRDLDRVAPRVIAQDALVNDFTVAPPQPEEAEQKTLDPQQAQLGSNDGSDAENAAAAAEAVVLAREQEARREAELAERMRLEQLERERTAAEEERLAVERVRQDQLAQDSARKEQAANEAAQRLALEQAAQQRQAEDRAAQEKAALDKLAQQKAAQEQERAEQEQLALQTAEREKAAQDQQLQERAEQQRVAAERAAEQERAAQERLAQERAAQDRAAQQRANDLARERAVAQTGSGAASEPAGAANGQPGAGVSASINGAASPLGKSARELVKGLDLLKGAPPGPMARQNRRVVVGSNERDVPLRMFVDSWRQKIERNGTINYPPSWANIVRIDPLVNVALRSDGSVEEVTIIRSSGRADMDEAVRRIVRVNARYSAFPPNVASRSDVIDIRRVWKFDEALKLMEELP